MSLYLVTGGAGFIGSHLADALLAAGHDVRVLDDFSTGRMENLDPRVAVMRGDAADPGLAARAMAGAAGCFHLAAVASVQRGNEDWPGTHRANQGATVAILDAARGAGRIPVVYASSAAVYGDLGEAVAREDAPCRPLTAYGADKFGSELHAAVGWGVHGVPSAGLRFFNVYGPRQDPSSPYSGVISIFARRACAGETLSVHGDGGQCRDFIHVSDVVAHLMAAMRHVSAHPGAIALNVCTGRATTVLELARLVAEAAGCAPEIAHGPARAGDIRRSLGDPSRTRALLEVSAKVGLAEGLRALIGQG